MLPAYRLTVYAPRSVDPTETTPLTPAAGAPHSDPFVVTTIQGVTGAKPYLELPTSRGATIDPLNKKTTVGTLTIRLLDARTTPGGSNANRWVTAFIGDGKGSNALLGRLVKIEESTDGGSTWNATPYFTGRISSPALQGKLWIQFSLSDVADDLGMDVFVGAPHTATAAYAALAQVAPIGLLQPVRAAATSTSPGVGYAGLPLTTALRGITQPPNGPAFDINLDPSNGDHLRTIVTQAFIAAAFRALSANRNSDVTLAGAQPVKVMIATAGSGVYHEYDLDFAALGADASGKILNGRFSTSMPRIQVRQTQKAGSAAPPSAGTIVDYYVIDPAAHPSEQTPLLIDDVNPVTYAQHLCAGYFGRLDAAGNVVRSVAFNAGGIDGSKLLPYRIQVKKASKLNAELEALCLQYNWAYYVDGAGAVTLVDLSRAAVTAPVATLTDADLDSPLATLNWQQDRNAAVTSFLATFYPEQQITAGQLPKPFDIVDSLDELPNIPTVGVTELAGQSVLVSEIGARSADMKPTTFKLDAKGLRFRVDTTQKSVEYFPATGKQSRLAAIQNALVAYSDEISGPFGLGPSYIDIACRRSSANAALVTPGKYAALTFAALPDPATNRRGGPRLGFCVSRTLDGPRVKLRILDAGANAVALPPTFGVPSLSNGVISLPVTLNASSEPVRVRYAATDQSVALRPADNDPAWTNGPLVQATGTAKLARLPAGQRIWLDGRSIPGAGTGFKLPSAWTSPATDHIDLTLIAPPSNVAVGGTTLDRHVVSWTNGDAAVPIEVFLVAGALLIAGDATKLGTTLPAGTIKTALPVLTTGATYTVGVRHRDTSGGVSVLATLTFVATAVLGSLDPPSDPVGFSGSQDPRYGFPQEDGVYGLAVAATEFPGFIEFQEAVETGLHAGTYTTPTTVAKVPNVQGDWTLFERLAPNDGLHRQLTARQLRDGASPSSYTDPVIVLPWTAKRLGMFSTVTIAEQLNGFTWEDSADGTQRTFRWTRGALVDTVHVYARTLDAPIESDPFDFAGLLPNAVLRVGTDSYTVTKPVHGEQVFVQFEPRMADFTAGPLRRMVVDPAPSAMSVKIRRTITNATADLEIEVDGGVSDWPIELDVFEDDPDGAPLLTTTLTEHTILDKIGYPQLGGRALPDRQIEHWWAEVENVGGMKDWDVAAASRDPLAVASVTVLDYRANAEFLVVLDNDTDAVRFTVPGGRTKTITTPSGTGHALYTVGDTLDDTTTENALKVDETRTGYLIEARGGGTWLPIWGNGGGQGVLHGQPSNPPTIEVIDTGLSANGDTASPSFVIRSPVGEDVGLFLKDSEGISAPIYSRTSGVGSTALGYVSSGTTIGAADYFSAGGAPTHKLANIPLVRDQIKRIYLQVIGKDSGVESPWIPVPLSLLAQPWLESTSLAWDEVNAVLRATAIGGAHCASVKIEFSDSSTFASITSTVTVALADGASTTQTLALSVGQLGKPWYARFTPSNNATWGTGLPGAAQVQEVAVPAPTAAKASGTVAIDSNGRWSFTVDLPSNANSIRYGSLAGGVTSGYVADATVAASGSIVNATVHADVNGGGTLSFGQTIWLTIVPFTGASGTGTALAAIHIRGSYVTYTASKTVTYSRMSWNDLGRLGFTSDSNNSIISPAVPVGTIRDRFGMTAIVPVGVVLTFASFDVVWNSATNPLGSFVLSVYANGGVLNFGSASQSGAQTVAFSLGSATLSSGQVGFYSNWGNALGSATADAGQAELHDVALTYTQTTPTTTV